MKKRWPALVSIVLVLLITIVGCAATSSDQTMANPDTEVASRKQMAEEPMENMAADAPTTGGGGGYSTEISEEMGGYTPDIQNWEKKLTYSYYVELETKTFEEDNGKVAALAEKYDAYVESSTRYEGSIEDEYASRNTYFSFRVPAEKGAAFVEELSSQFHLRSSNQDVQDITQSYYDTATWLKTLEDQYARMETLLEKAEILEDVIAIESKMTQLQTDLNRAYNAMQYQEKQVAYSWVNVSLNEVVKTTPKSSGIAFGERLSDAFKNSWSNFVYALQSFVVALTASLPFILLFGAIIVVLIAVLRKRRKNALAGLLKEPNRKESEKVKEEKK